MPSTVRFAADAGPTHRRVRTHSDRIAQRRVPRRRISSTVRCAHGLVTRGMASRTPRALASKAFTAQSTAGWPKWASPVTPPLQDRSTAPPGPALRNRADGDASAPKMTRSPTTRTRSRSQHPRDACGAGTWLMTRRWRSPRAPTLRSGALRAGAALDPAVGRVFGAGRGRAGGDHDSYAGDERADPAGAGMAAEVSELGGRTPGDREGVAGRGAGSPVGRRNSARQRQRHNPRTRERAGRVVSARPA